MKLTSPEHGPPFLNPFTFSRKYPRVSLIRLSARAAADDELGRDLTRGKPLRELRRVRSRKLFALTDCFYFLIALLLICSSPFMNVVDWNIYEIQ